MSEQVMQWLTKLSSGAWRSEAVAFYLVSLLAALIVYRVRPDARITLRRMAGMSLLGLCALYLSSFNAGLGSMLLQAAEEGGVILLGLVLIRLWVILGSRVLLPFAGFAPPRIVEDIAVSLGYLGLGLVLLHRAGLQLSQLFTTSAVITAVLAFSMQDTIGNLLAGLALQVDRSIDLGDWIKLDDLIGRVVEINWRATSIETRNWETVVVPNSLLLKQKFTILGKRRNAPKQWRRWVHFNLSWETLPTQIIQVIENALQEAHIPNMAHEPPPNCVLMGFETGFSHYAVRYWLTDLASDDGTDSLVRAHVDAALRRHGLRMAAPQYNVMTTKENEKYHEARQKRHQEERLAILNGIDLFSTLNEAEKLQLADGLKFTPFVTGDIVVHQGQVDTWLYILLKGEVEMWYRDEEDGSEHLIDILGPGNIFGEMGLLTGAARNATAVARSAVECFRVDKETFQGILNERQELVAALSLALEKRLAERQEKLGRLTENEPAEVHSEELMGRVLRFFGLARS
jgi:small-conductance mechanosensitive channel/CRP-like cAMP-binding protein